VFAILTVLYQTHTHTTVCRFLVAAEVYLSVCNVTLDMFDCVDGPGGTTVMFSDPRVECWTGSHAVTTGVAGVITAVYLVGMPVGTIWRLAGIARKDKLEDVSEKARWGLWYGTNVSVQTNALFDLFGILLRGTG
jgi:hypothetical protein